MTRFLVSLSPGSQSSPVKPAWLPFQPQKRPGGAHWGGIKPLSGVVTAGHPLSSRITARLHRATNPSAFVLRLLCSGDLFFPS